MAHVCIGVLRNSDNRGVGVAAPAVPGSVRRAARVFRRTRNESPERTLADFVLHVRAVWVPSARPDENGVGQGKAVTWGGRRGAAGVFVKIYSAEKPTKTAFASWISNAFQKLRARAVLGAREHPTSSPFVSEPRVFIPL